MKEHKDLISESSISKNMDLGFVNENIKINIDFSLGEYPFKRRYPWHLKINLRLKQFFADLKNASDRELIKNLIEKKLHKLINAHCEFKQVSKFELNDNICYHWYIECPKIDYASSKVIIDEIKQLSSIKFQIDEDPKWVDVKHFF